MTSSLPRLLSILLVLCTAACANADFERSLESLGETTLRAQRLNAQMRDQQERIAFALDELQRDIQRVPQLPDALFDPERDSDQLAWIRTILIACFNQSTDLAVIQPALQPDDPLNSFSFPERRASCEVDALSLFRQDGRFSPGKRDFVDNKVTLVLDVSYQLKVTLPVMVFNLSSLVIKTEQNVRELSDKSELLSLSELGLDSVDLARSQKVRFNAEQVRRDLLERLKMIEKGVSLQRWVPYRGAGGQTVLVSGPAHTLSNFASLSTIDTLRDLIFDTVYPGLVAPPERFRLVEQVTINDLLYELLNSTVDVLFRFGLPPFEPPTDAP